MGLDFSMQQKALRLKEADGGPAYISWEKCALRIWFACGFPAFMYGLYAVFFREIYASNHKKFGFFEGMRAQLVSKYDLARGRCFCEIAQGGAFFHDQLLPRPCRNFAANGKGSKKNNV